MAFLKVGVASVDVEVANPIHNKEKVMEVIKKADKNGVKLLDFSGTCSYCVHL